MTGARSRSGGFGGLPGSLTGGLLTGLREGVEASLIVGIILAYLVKTGNRQHFGKIWAGTAAALALSLTLGVVLFLTLGGLKKPYEQLFFFFFSSLAAGVLTQDALLDAPPGAPRQG